MIKLRRESVVAFMASLTTLVVPGRAAPIYSYQVSSTSVMVSPAQTATFNLFLFENGAPSLIAGESGMNSAGALAQRTTTGLTANLSTITGFQLASPYVPGGGLATGQAQGSGGFSLVASGSISNAGGSNAFTFSEVASTNVALGNTGNGVTAASNEVYLGSITITGAVNPGTTTFTLGERGSPNNWTTTATHFYDLDVTNNASNGGGATYTGVGSSVSTFSVTVVPEPGADILCGALGIGLLMQRRRRSILTARACSLRAARDVVVCDQRCWRSHGRLPASEFGLAPRGKMSHAYAFREPDGLMA
jgi:hypothetical protein